VCLSLLLADTESNFVDGRVIFTIGIAQGLACLTATLSILLYNRFVLALEWGFKSAAERVWQTTKNMLNFCVLFSVVAVYTTFFAWYSLALTDTIKDELTEAAECNAAGRSDCSADQVLPFGLVVTFYVLSGVYTSLSLFIVFGRHAWMIDFWTSGLRSYRTGNNISPAA